MQSRSAKVLSIIMPLLEPCSPILLDGIPAINRCPVRPQQSRVLRVERGQGGRIALDICIVKFFAERGNCLAQFWIGCVCLLGKSRQSKADCQTYKGR